MGAEGLRRARREHALLGRPGRQVLHRLDRQHLPQVRERAVGAEQRVGEEAADGEADPIPTVVGVPQQRLGGGFAHLPARIVQELSESFDEQPVVEIAEGGDGGGANGRLFGTLSELQHELGLPRLPVLAEFEGRQRRHAHFRPQMIEQSQSRRRVDAERRAERLHLGHGTAGRQIRRPFLAIGQALGQ